MMRRQAVAAVLAKMAALMALATWAGYATGDLRAAADDDAPTWNRDAAIQLFKLGWDVSPEARLAVDERFEALGRSAKGDPRLSYAMALIKIKQLRYQEAIQLLSDLVATHPKDLAAWRAKIWLSVLSKNYNQALVEIESASAQIPPGALTDPVKAEPVREFAAFLGRIYGFLEGPVASSTSEAQRLAQRRKLVASLAEEPRRAFEENREATTLRYLELSDQAIAVKERVKEDVEIERDEKLKDLDEEQQQLEKRRGELTSHRDKLRGELKSEIDELEKQERPLADDFRRIDVQATAVRRDLSNVVAEINRLEAQLSREEDRLIRDRLRFELSRLRRIADRHDADLSGLTRRAVGIQSQRAALHQKAAGVQNNYGRQIAAADKELADIQKKEGRSVGTEKRLRKPPVAITAETRAKASQAASLNSYELFPLDQERQRLIDMFR